MRIAMTASRMGGRAVEFSLEPHPTRWGWNKLHAPRTMADQFGSNVCKRLDDRVNGFLDALAPECSIPNHVEQIVGKTSS